MYASPLFAQHAAYVRQQLIYCLLQVGSVRIARAVYAILISLMQEEDTNILRIAVTFLLADAREHEQTFDLLSREAAFPRLVELVAHPKKHDESESMHRALMELLYEMSRIQKITNDDLSTSARVQAFV